MLFNPNLGNQFPRIFTGISQLSTGEMNLEKNYDYYEKYLMSYAISRAPGTLNY